MNANVGHEASAGIAAGSISQCRTKSVSGSMLDRGPWVAGGLSRREVEAGMAGPGDVPPGAEGFGVGVLEGLAKPGELGFVAIESAEQRSAVLEEDGRPEAGVGIGHAGAVAVGTRSQVKELDGDRRGERGGRGVREVTRQGEGLVVRGRVELDGPAAQSRPERPSL